MWKDDDERAFALDEGLFRFIHRLLYEQRKYLRYLSSRKLCRYGNWFGNGGEEIRFVPLPVIETRPLWGDVRNIQEAC
jgi:hypothetical protein